MCNVIRSVEKPVLGFKILAGGFSADRPELTEQAFQFALNNVKQTDGVIVGMLPVFTDQVSENAALASKYGQVFPGSF